MPKDIRKYIGSFKDNMKLALEGSAEYALALSKSRIASGRTATNRKMKSKAKKRTDDYASSYVYDRTRANRATSPFDLNLTGRLLRNYVVSRVKKRTANNLEVNLFVRNVAIPSKDITYAELARIHEEGNSLGNYRGQGKIFGVTDKEQAKVAKEFYRILKSSLK